MDEAKSKSTAAKEAGLGGNEADSRAMDEALQSSFTILKLVISVLVVYLIFSNTSTVEDDKEGVIILRFGQPRSDSTNEVWKSGIRFAWPYPLEERVSIKRETPVKVSDGFFYANKPQVGAESQAAIHPAKDGYILTRDNKILHIRAQLKYSIISPTRYKFGFKDANAIIKLALESAITHAAADTKLESVYSNPANFGGKVLARIREIEKQYNLGVKIDSVTIAKSDVVLPFMTQKARQQFAESKQNKDGKHPELVKAKGYLDQIRKTYSLDSTENPEGEVATVINKANSEARTRMARVESLRDQFYNIYGGRDGKPVNSPAERMRALEQHYYKVIKRILDNSDIKVYLVSSRPGGARQKIRLLINPKPPAPKKPAGPAPGGPPPPGN